MEGDDGEKSELSQYFDGYDRPVPSGNHCFPIQGPGRIREESGRVSQSAGGNEGGDERDGRFSGHVSDWESRDIQGLVK